MEPNVLVKINALDNTKEAFRSLASNLEQVEKGTRTVRERMQALEPTFKKMAAVGTVAFGALAAGLTYTVQEARNAEAAQFRLSHILRTATGATDEQIAALNAQAEALEKVGVVSGESITQAQAQLATFDLQAETIAKLTPAILDYVVAEKGATASTEDLKQLTNGLAQALNGNFGSLTRVGFVLDDVTKEMISNGTEAERAAALVSVLNSTYEGMNEAARGTAEGGLVALRNETGRLAETIGQQFLPIANQITEALLPVITRITEWIQANPELTRNIILVTAAVAGLVAVVGTISLALLAFNPVVLGVIAVLAALGAGFWGLWETMQNFANLWGALWVTIKDAAATALDWLEAKLGKLMDVVRKAIDLLAQIPGVGTAIKLSKSVFNLVDPVMSKLGGRAAGGPVVAGVPYQVGEHGRELFVPNQSGSIIPNGALAGVGAGAGGNIIINISGTFMDDRAAARRMSDEIMHTLKQQIRL